MENASKALLMAAGILISVLTIGLCVMVYNNMTSLSNQKKQILETEQLAKYNLEWESYNRDNLRGADVISIYNKAMNINQKYREQEGINYDMITVYFRLNGDIVEYYDVYGWNKSDGKYSNKKTSSTRTIIAEGKIYNSKDETSTINEFMTTKLDDNNSYRIIKSEDSDYKNYNLLELKEVNGHKPYIEYYNAKAAFKLLNFKCEHTSEEGKSGLVYDNYGRITEIHLIEI